MSAIDYTKFRKGSKHNGRLIDYCPKCGCKGRKTTYKDGTMYVHTAHIQFGFLHVDAACYIKRAQQ